MKNFDSRVYSISDFLEWHENDLLVLSPDFQRRAVWSKNAKSFLVDTILRGKPIPKILITQKLQGTRTIRQVVDGQQRLRAIIEFYNGDVKISKVHYPDLAGKVFETLPVEFQRDFLQYELGVDVLFDVPYEDLLDIFARINSYTVSLNKHEKFNAQYLGYFKTTVFRYGHRYVRYFLDAKILTQAKVARMGEAELAADLFIALLGGIQTNKNIEKFYKTYEDKEGNLPACAKQFDLVMTVIGELYPAKELRNTNWSRIHLFYTLFTTIAHGLFRIKGPDDNAIVDFKKQNIGKIRVALDSISERYDLVADNLNKEGQPEDYKDFIEKSRRATTDTGIRVDRTNFLGKMINEYLT